MKATDFEYRHQTFLHQLLVAAAFLTYFMDREDIIWRLVKNSSAPRALERSFFVVATLLIGLGAGLCTWAHAYPRLKGTSGGSPYPFLRHARHFGELSFSIGLGFLVPLYGFLILVSGELLRVLRLMRLEDQRAQKAPKGLAAAELSPAPKPLIAFRREAVKWGLLLTMVVFVITLNDRVAEVLGVCALLVGLWLNPPRFQGRGASDQAG